MQCQKCLQMGHYMYECKNERAYTYRESKSKQLASAKEPVFSLELPPDEREKRAREDEILDEEKKDEHKKKKARASASSGQILLRTNTYYIFITSVN